MWGPRRIPERFVNKNSSSNRAYLELLVRLVQVLELLQILLGVIEGLLLVGSSVESGGITTFDSVDLNWCLDGLLAESGRHRQTSLEHHVGRHDYWKFHIKR